MHGLVTECCTVYRAACDILPNSTVHDPGNPATDHRRVRAVDMPGDEHKKWKFLMEGYFIPMNRRTVELLREKVHLLEVPGVTPASIPQFLKHAAAFEALHKMAQAGSETNEDTPASAGSAASPRRSVSACSACARSTAATCMSWGRADGALCGASS